jgi:hypothetical protein
MTCTCIPWRVEKPNTSYRRCSYPGVPGHSTLRAWVRRGRVDGNPAWQAFVGGVDVHEIVPSATRAEARAKADRWLGDWCRRWTGSGLQGCGCGGAR